MKGKKYLIPVFIAVGTVIVLLLFSVINRNHPADSDESVTDASSLITETAATDSGAAESDTDPAESVISETDDENPEEDPGKSEVTSDAESRHSGADPVPAGNPDALDSVTDFPGSSDEVPENDGTRQPEESRKETTASAGETSAPESASDTDTEISDTTVPRNGSDDPDFGDYPDTDTGTDAQGTTVPASDITGQGIELPVIPLR